MRAHLIAATVLFAVPLAALSQATSPKPCLPGKDQLDMARTQAMIRSQSPTPRNIDWSKVAMPPTGKAVNAVTRNSPEKLLPCAQTGSVGTAK